MLFVFTVVLVWNLFTVYERIMFSKFDKKVLKFQIYLIVPY